MESKKIQKTDTKQQHSTRSPSMVILINLIFFWIFNWFYLKIDKDILPGYENIVRLLKISGADVNHKDHNGFTPVHRAIVKGNFVWIR